MYSNLLGLLKECVCQFSNFETWFDGLLGRFNGRLSMLLKTILVDRANSTRSFRHLLFLQTLSKMNTRWCLTKLIDETLIAKAQIFEVRDLNVCGWIYFARIRKSVYVVGSRVRSLIIRQRRGAKCGWSELFGLRRGHVRLVAEVVVVFFNRVHDAKVARAERPDARIAGRPDLHS